jgi:hypothetical protein
MKWIIKGHQNKLSIINREKEEISVVQGRDGKLKIEQYDFLCSKVKMAFFRKLSL